jgi:hypothetical protein
MVSADLLYFVMSKLTSNAACRSPCCENPEKEHPLGPIDRLGAVDAWPAGHRPPTEPETGQDASDMLTVETSAIK